MASFTVAPATISPRHLLQWLVRLRWVAVVGQVAGVLAGVILLPDQFPLHPLLLLIVCGLLSNLGLVAWLHVDRDIPEWQPGFVLGLDVLLLTGLLGFSGGPANPFTTIYLVHVTLAAAAMPGPWAMGLGLLSILGYAFLFFLSVPVHGLMAMDHGNGAGSLHLVGMLAAFAVTAILIAWFVGRMFLELRSRANELMGLRDIAARRERLASLATMAAGVAHELATPLGTIAVAAGELDRSIQVLDPAGAGPAKDVALIRQEVRRCRSILEELAEPGGSAFEERLQPLDWARILATLDEDCRSRIQADLGPADGDLVPLTGLARAFRALVANARDASAAGSRIGVRTWKEGRAWTLRVTDEGQGMMPEALAHAGEPFYTTKGVGEGMGLGLFLARTYAEQLGGGLRLSSVPGRGTQVDLWWPEIRRG
jgi:two-component system sensor histidine kinase RegB